MWLCRHRLLSILGQPSRTFTPEWVTRSSVTQPQHRRHGRCSLAWLAASSCCSPALFYSEASKRWVVYPVLGWIERVFKRLPGVRQRVPYNNAPALLNYVDRPETLLRNCAERSLMARLAPASR